MCENCDVPLPPCTQLRHSTKWQNHRRDLCMHEGSNSRDSRRKIEVLAAAAAAAAAEEEAKRANPAPPPNST